MCLHTWKVCMYVYICVCVCVFVCIYVCMYVCMYVLGRVDHIQACMEDAFDVLAYMEGMYACMYVCMCILGRVDHTQACMVCAFDIHTYTHHVIIHIHKHAWYALLTYIHTHIM